MRTLLVSWILVVATSAGCATHEPLDPFVQARLGLRAKGVVVDQIRETKLPDGTLRIGVGARSTVGSPIAIRYRVNWIDASGLPIRTTLSTWQPRQLDARQALDFAAVGPGPRAVGYSIDFQRQ